MKCPTCESCEYAQYCGASEILRKCERHNKKVKQTNEEWLHTLNTEQLAEVLFSWYKLGRLDVINKHTELKKDWLIGWLKQPHNSPK